MFDSTVLDVAIGLSFAFLSVALAASAVTEAIASAVKWRSRTLLKGIKDLLNDQHFDGLARELYNSAFISPRDNGQAEQQGALRNLPSYIDPGHFADALMAAAGISGAAANAWTLRQRLTVADPQIRGLLQTIIDRSAGDVAKIRKEIADWFDAAMDRVGGAYKRWAQLVSFLVALAITVGLNISALNVAKALWEEPLIARAISPTQDASKALEQLDKLPLPIGWARYRAPLAPAPKPAQSAATGQGGTHWWRIFSKDRGNQGETAAAAPRPWRVSDLCFWDWVELVVGWLITAGAALFGAPFWFDLLQRLIRLKGSGPSPAERKRDTAAAA